MGVADDAGGLGDNAEDMASEHEEQFDDAADTGDEDELDGRVGEPYDEPTEQPEPGDEEYSGDLGDDADFGESERDDDVGVPGQDEGFEETGDEDLGGR